MFLEKIGIKNFRCFDSNGIVACFNKGVNAIIGENNTGKSALIDAVRIAFSTVPYQHNIYFKTTDFHLDLSGVRAQEAQFDLYFAEVPMELIEIWIPDSGNHGEFHIRFYLTKTITGEEKVKFSAWGGSFEGNSLPSDLFDSIDISYLGALRDAEDGLRPSRNSRLAALLGKVVDSQEKRQDLISILTSANQQLLQKEQIHKIKNIINSNLDNIEQEILSQRIDIGFTEPRFESIASTIRSWISMKWVRIRYGRNGADRLATLSEKPVYKHCIEVYDDYMLVNIPVFLQIALQQGDITTELEKTLQHYQQCFELQQNGLGYNNLIYMSTILGDLSIDTEGIHQRLLLVEEPEAHLHPQLQELVYKFFQKQHGTQNIQVVFTSHSPTLVSKIGLDQINLLYEKTHIIHCMPMSQCKAASNPTDKNHLKKYLDVTKSQMFFAKGLIFVEGISEAIIIPDVANSLNRSLDKYAVEVVNVDSLAFRPFAHLLYRQDGMPAYCKAAIITDDDRCIKKDDYYISTDIDYDDDIDGIAAKLENGNKSERFSTIQKLCDEASILLCGAKKTLEYELAFCENNITAMVNILKGIYPDIGEKLQQKVAQCRTVIEKQIRVWLFIRKRDKCKGELAQAISELIAKGIIDHQTYFVIPDYLKRAVYHVTEPLNEGNEE